MTTITAEWYTPVETVTEGHRKDTITAPGDHTVKGVPSGKYQAGDEVSPFDLSRAHLRQVAASRTPSGKLSAEARMAAKELARNKANKRARSEVSSLVSEALAEAGLLD